MSPFRALLVVGPLFAWHPAHAQPTRETIAVRVATDSGRALAAATVTVVRGPDRLTLQSLTDSTGGARVVFDNGTGDYLVHITAAGYRSVRRRVQRDGNERTMTATFVMAPDLTQLAAVKVRGVRDEKPPVTRTMFDVEPGASDFWVNGVNGVVSPELAGSLEAGVLTTPGMIQTSAGPSVGGLDANANLQTLNGGAFLGGALPRAARVDTRVSSSTYDATRGGFNGAAIDVQLGPGSRNYQRRNGYINVAAPPMFGAASAAGIALSSAVASVGADGPLFRRRLTYNVAAEGRADTYRTVDLFTPSSRGIGTGVGSVPIDSLTRLRAAASSIGVPSRALGNAFDVLSQTASLIGRVDDTRDSLSQRTLLAYAHFSAPPGVSADRLAASSVATRNRSSAATLQGTASRYFDRRLTVLGTLRVNASVLNTHQQPLLQLPAVQLVFADSTLTSSPERLEMRLGGSGNGAASSTRSVLDGTFDVTALRKGTAHRLHAQLMSRVDIADGTRARNVNGTYLFRSIDDLATNRASMLTLTRGVLSTHAQVVNSAVALSHEWTPQRQLRFIYGARLDAARVLSRLPIADGLSSTPHEATPGTFLAVSPRVGFQYSYLRRADPPGSVRVNEAGTFYRFPAGYIQGGIGRFRPLLQPDMFGALTSGRAAAVLSSVSCIGADIVPFSWQNATSDALLTDARCLSTPSTPRATGTVVPSVASDFALPSTWKATLIWGHRLGTTLVRFDGELALTSHVSDVVQGNRNAVSRTTLPGEANRSLFVPRSAINPTLGIADASFSRVDGSIASAPQRQSALAARSQRVMISVTPAMHTIGRSTRVLAQLSYTLGQARAQYHDDELVTSADDVPRLWAPSSLDARHSIQLQAALMPSRVATITISGRFQSGTPYTPLVDGDINGDGIVPDRAFISPTVRVAGKVPACLAEQVGRVAAENSCRGPWFIGLDATVAPKWSLTMAGHPLRANIALRNLPAGVDALLHGTAHTRGWGASSLPEPVLLSARSFDPATGRYAYVTNARFGQPTRGATANAGAFRVSLDFSVDFSTDYELQQLRRAMEPTRERNTWQPRSVASIMLAYLRGTSSPYRFVLSQSDSLFLSTTQMRSLARADSVYADSVRTLYSGLSERLYAMSAHMDARGLQLMKATRSDYQRLFWAQLQPLTDILAPAQRELLVELRAMMDTRPEDRMQSEFDLGFPVSRERVGR